MSGEKFSHLWRLGVVKVKDATTRLTEKDLIAQWDESQREDGVPPLGLVPMSAWQEARRRALARIEFGLVPASDYRKVFIEELLDVCEERGIVA